MLISVIIPTLNEESCLKETLEAVGRDVEVIVGGFSLKIDSKGFSFRMIEAVANMRAKYLGLIYGDQAIFVRKDAFFSAGGFNGLPLMEDVDLIRRLRESGGGMLLDAEGSTSPRQG